MVRRSTDKLVIACTAISILCVVVVVVVSWTVLDTSRRTERNAATVAQVCDLVMNTHADRFRRYSNALDYLRTPDPGSRALNEYIRTKSLPQTRDEVVKERKSLPKTCVARYERTGKRLPKIPPLPAAK